MSYRPFTICILVFIATSVFAGPQLMLGFGYAPTIDVSDSTDGSPVFQESGTFYDEFSPELSLLWDFGSVSLGVKTAFLFASDAFTTGQPTRFTAFSIGGEFVYNYVMHEGGDWLSPIILDGGWQSAKLCYKPNNSDIELTGEGWNMQFSFGVERVWDRRASLAFIVGHRFSRAEIDGSEYGIEPHLDGDDWHFALISRFGFPSIGLKE